MKFLFLILVQCGLILSPLLARDVDYQWQGQNYQGFYLPGKDPKAPLVFLLHDWDGLTEYEKKRSAMLQKMGFSVFAADLFGKGIRPVKIKDRKEHTGELYKDRAKMRGIMQAGLLKARELGSGQGKRVALGYCFGGAAVLELARSRERMDVFASFHGGLKTPEKQSYNSTQGKVLIYHGTADTMITMGHFAALAEELEKAGVMHEMISYGGAPHAFTVFGGNRYHQEADLSSWRHLSASLQSLK